MQGIKIVGFFLISVIGLSSCSKTSRGTNPGFTDSTIAGSKPVLRGKLVYHHYDVYGSSSSLFLFDFSTGILKEISAGWNLFDPMNAHLNPDASRIIFMAEAVKDGKWDIYLYTLGSDMGPVNLTANDGCRDEDPKFAPDGLSICFKRTEQAAQGNIFIMKLQDHSVKQITYNSVESGMPYFSANGSHILYAQGSGDGSDIYSIGVDGTGNTLAQGLRGLQEYYPIGADTDSYFFSRWSATANPYDQIYRGYYSGATATKLSFNKADADYSDAFPCDSTHILISCDKNGGAGGYDLYVADLDTGETWSLNTYNSQINTLFQELGACYR